MLYSCDIFVRSYIFDFLPEHLNAIHKSLWESILCLEGGGVFFDKKEASEGENVCLNNPNLIVFLTGLVWALTLSMNTVKKSFLVAPSSSGKEVSKVDLKKFLVKSCKDKYNDKDKGKDNDGKDVDKVEVLCEVLEMDLSAHALNLVIWKWHVISWRKYLVQHVPKWDCLGAVNLPNKYEDIFWKFSCTLKPWFSRSWT